MPRDGFHCQQARDGASLSSPARRRLLHGAECTGGIGALVTAVAYVPDEAIERMNELTGRAFKLYAYYCKRADENGECYPSLALTAADCGWQKSHASEARKELLEEGWIYLNEGVIACQTGFVRRSQNGNNVPKTGTEIVPKTGIIVPKTGTGVPKTGTEIVPKTGIIVPKTGTGVPKTGTENSQNGNESFPKRELHIGITSPINQPNEPAQKETHVESADSTAGGFRSADVQAVFAYWQIVLNHSTAKLTADRRRRVEARLREGYTVEQIKQAIAGCATSPFHRGENDKGQVYDDLELICRSGSKLESFIARSNGNGHKQSTRQTRKSGEPINAANCTEEEFIADVVRLHQAKHGVTIDAEVVR